MSDVFVAQAHGDQALANLASQFKGKVNISKIMSVIGDEMDEIETMFLQLLNDRAIDVAQGEQLDVIGRFLNLSRGSDNDPDYRAKLYTKIDINNCSGTPDEVIDITLSVLGIDSLKYQEVNPGKVRLTLFNDTWPDAEAVRSLKQIMPVCVGPLEMLSWVDNDPVFSFSSTDGPTDDPNPIAGGFATIDTISGDPEGGGILASIFEVPVQ